MSKGYSGQATGSYSPMDFVAPELGIQQRQLERQQQIAELLRAQSLQPTDTSTQMVGGWAIPNSSFRPIEKIAQALMARNFQDRADQSETELSSSRGQALAQALSSGNGAPDMKRGMLMQALGVPESVVTQMMLGSKNHTQVIGTGDSQQLFNIPEYGPIPTSPVASFDIGISPDAKFNSGANDLRQGNDIGSREKIAAAGDATSSANAALAAGVSQGNAQLSATTQKETSDAALKQRGMLESPDYQAQVERAKSGVQLQTEKEKAKIAATQALPEVEANANMMLGQIDSVLASPGKDKVVGSVIGNLQQYIPGRPEADFKARLDQIKGGTFLEAYQKLKGGGQITEIEGAKATSALNRMSASQSPSEFETAAKEFRTVVEAARDRARARSTSPDTPAGLTPSETAELAALRARFGSGKP